MRIISGYRFGVFAGIALIWGGVPSVRGAASALENERACLSQIREWATSECAPDHPLQTRYQIGLSRGEQSQALSVVLLGEKQDRFCLLNDSPEAIVCYPRMKKRSSVHWHSEGKDYWIEKYAVSAPGGQFQGYVNLLTDAKRGVQAVLADEILSPRTAREVHREQLLSNGVMKGSPLELDRKIRSWIVEPKVIGHLSPSLRAELHQAIRGDLQRLLHAQAKCPHPSATLQAGGACRGLDPSVDALWSTSRDGTGHQKAPARESAPSSESVH